MDKKLWKRGQKLRDNLEQLVLDARDAGEHELSQAVERAVKELRHSSFTNHEDKLDG